MNDSNREWDYGFYQEWEERSWLWKETYGESKLMEQDFGLLSDN